MEKRVEFPKGKQTVFLDSSRKKLGLTWKETTRIFGLKFGTIKSYRNELCRLPEYLFLDIIRKTGSSGDRILEKYNAKIVDFDPTSVIGRKCFGEIREKLSRGNITYKENPKNFNTKIINLGKKDKEKGLVFPKKLTPKLAEEIGISLGDGFLSNKRYEYRLKGNKNEKKYYDKFIKNLYKSLFNLDLNIKEYESTYGFEIYSKGLWEFKNKILGIRAGRKDGISLPEIIKVKDKKILTAFIRGIFDTDGSVSFIKKYKQFGNYYPTISLSLKSEAAIKGIAEILTMLGLNPKVCNSEPYWLVYLNGYKRLELYSKLIGWSNPVKIDKVIRWKRKYPELGEEVMAAIV